MDTIEKCLMCGMELLPTVKEYHQPHHAGNGKKKIQNRKFCDVLCYHHFMKRVWADEHGVKLDM